MKDNDFILKNIKNKWKLMETLISHNSLNEPIDKNEDSIKNFWNWFGQSKMVDNNGQPLVFYHTTTSQFEEFDVLRGSGVAGTGIYLTNMKFDDDRYGDINLELYVKCLNPLDLSSGDDAINEQAKKMKLVGLYELSSIPQMREWSKDFREKMLQLGYDGCFIKPQGERSGEKHLVVYNPDQVKSVNNNGDFDVNSNNIMKEL